MAVGWLGITTRDSGVRLQVNRRLLGLTLLTCGCGRAT
jgi:hypothetical protein